MGEWIAGIAVGAFGLLFMVAGLAFTIFYIAAFGNGAELWFGWNGVVACIVGAFLVFGLRGLGTVIAGVVGGYGAYYGWHWSLWLTILVFFPGLAFMAGSLAFAALGAIFSRQRA